MVTIWEQNLSSLILYQISTKGVGHRFDCAHGRCENYTDYYIFCNTRSCWFANGRGLKCRVLEEASVVSIDDYGFEWCSSLLRTYTLNYLPLWSSWRWEQCILLWCYPTTGSRQVGRCCFVEHVTSIQLCSIRYLFSLSVGSEDSPFGLSGTSRPAFLDARFHRESIGS